MSESPDPLATRRIPQHVDAKGNLSFFSTRSPTSFKQRALCVAPPHTVIPVIFVPGIMGTRLRNTQTKASVWNPPNSGGEKLGELLHRFFQKRSERQRDFNPDNTEVDPEGPCSVPDGWATMHPDEAQRRGWGALHQESYQDILQHLELSLNEKFTLPGLSDKQGNALREEIGLLTYLRPPASRVESAAQTSSTAASSEEQPDYQHAADKTAEAWGMAPPKLSAAQIDRFADYYYPVWACGYNWLHDNEESADLLLKKIDEVIKFYQNSGSFDCNGKVIVVTHSMGGLVARRAAQKNASQILGVVHGVQPVGGAPVVYRRFRAGTEVDTGHGTLETVQNAGAAEVLGWSAADTTPALACAPGALELLPTKHYPPGWLKFQQGTDDAMPPLPASDPYEEIYYKTTDECWWGMINPALIDPSGDIKTQLDKEGKGEAPIDLVLRKIKLAEKFHRTLGLFSHGNTYGYYGTDDAKYKSFGSVTWQTSTLLPTDKASLLKMVKTEHFNDAGTSKVSLGEDLTAKFKLSNDRDQAGDGTVPMASGALMMQFESAPKAVFKIADFNHQFSYKDPFSIRATVYSVVCLAQLADPPKP